MNILVIPYTHQLGSTHSLITISKYLSDLGHKVIVVGDGKYLSLASQNGLKTDKLIEIPIDYYRQKTDNADLSYLSEKEIKHFINEEIKLYKKYQVDLVISTLRMTARISTTQFGIPHISLTYAILSNYYALHISIPETHSLYKFHKVPVLFDLLNLLSYYVLMYLKRKWIIPYNNVCKKLGLKGYKDFYDLYSGDFTWLFDIREFAPIKKNAPVTYQYLGPLFNKISGPIPNWIDEVKRFKNLQNKRVIYLSMGSSGTFFPLLLNDLAKYCSKNNCILIANSCNHEVQKTYGDCDNVFLTDFALVESMFSVSDVLVTHGGRGTLYDSLQMKIPMIVIPHQAEQEFNANRIEQLKLGFKVSKANYSYDDLKEKLSIILNNLQLYKNNVGNFSKYFSDYNWQSVVKDTINSICQQNKC